MAGEDTIRVRTAVPHGIYKEQYLDGQQDVDVHITGLDPVDGQIIHHPKTGAVLTPIFEVPRTNGVLAAIAEKRLLDVDREASPKPEELEAAIKEARAVRAAARPAPVAQAQTVTLTQGELEARLQAARSEGQAAAQVAAKAETKKAE